MKYLIEGREVGKVIRENEIRIKRGDLIVTPVADSDEATRTDDKAVMPSDDKVQAIADTKGVDADADTKNAAVADEKAPTVSKSKGSTKK